MNKRLWLGHILSAGSIVILLLLVVLPAVCDGSCNALAPLMDSDLWALWNWPVFLIPCGLWVWMATSFFRTRQMKSPALWGWLLYIGNVFAAPAYFYAVYRLAHRCDA